MLARAAQMLPIVEAAYRVEARDGDWLETLGRACLPALDEGLGLCIFEFEFCIGSPPTLLQKRMFGMPGELAAAYPAMFERMPPSLQMKPFLLGPYTTGSEMMASAGDFRKNEMMQRYAHTFGMFDSVWITASEPSGWGCGIHAGRPEIRGTSASSKRQWSRVAAHIASAVRLRRALARQVNDAPASKPPEAIFSPDGQVHHAEGPAKADLALTRLRSCVMEMEEVRVKQPENERALAGWPGLVGARWSLVDHFESDGRRYVVARENAPAPPSIEALTLRERQIVGFAAIGHDNKVIAYELGISHSTVKVLMARAAAKLGATSREELLLSYRELCSQAPESKRYSQQQDRSATS